tara:strand:- start:63 stop:857 length:795 start_codon:yes stop_codon:yes gene_type:complete
MIKKVFISLKSIGFKRTIIKIIFKIFNFFSLKNYKRKKFEKNLFKIKSIEERFNKIYHTNYWLDSESRSGTGSSLKSTENTRVHLPKIIERFKVKKIFDAPCGDFNWMSKVLKNVDVEYIGSDIVEDLIVSNRKNQTNNIKFIKLDIRIDKLPVSDLMICRDCLFHFSYEDIFKFLNNFLISDIKYLLLTSHLNTKNNFENRDIVTGDFRKIDFFSKPFNFEKNHIYSFDDKDQYEIENFKQMYLFSKSQIKNNIIKKPPEISF